MRRKKQSEPTPESEPTPALTEDEYWRRSLDSLRRIKFLVAVLVVLVAVLIFLA